MLSKLQMLELQGYHPKADILQSGFSLYLSFSFLSKPNFISHQQLMAPERRNMADVALILHCFVFALQVRLWRPRLSGESRQSVQGPVYGKPTCTCPDPCSFVSLQKKDRVSFLGEVSRR